MRGKLYQTSGSKRKDWREVSQTRAEAKALGKVFALVLLGSTALITLLAVSEARK